MIPSEFLAALCSSLELPARCFGIYSTLVPPFLSGPLCTVPDCSWCWFQTSAGSYRTPELTAELILQNYSVQKYLVLDSLLLRFGSSS